MLKAERKRRALREKLQFTGFIDIEASDGGPDGWPIEIGLSRLVRDASGGNDPEYQTWSSLIRPAQGWDAQRWSRHAEAVHRISRHLLDPAPEAVAVAQALRDRIQGLILISDSPHNDQPWLERLWETLGAETQGLPAPKIHSPMSFLNGLMPDLSKAGLLALLRAEPSLHRAGPDAERLARVVARLALQ